MNDQDDKTTEQWAAFQKIWSETFTRMMQVGFTFSPESAPPEFMRQLRAGIFQGLTQAWEQFLRSPQFTESTRQWMDQAMAFRRMTSDFLTKARHETQDTARSDIDSLMLAMRHMETRILDRVEALAADVDELRQSAGTPAGAGQGNARTPAPRQARRPARGNQKKASGS